MKRRKNKIPSEPLKKRQKTNPKEGGAEQENHKGSGSILVAPIEIEQSAVNLPSKLTDRKLDNILAFYEEDKELLFSFFDKWVGGLRPSHPLYKRAEKPRESFEGDIQEFIKIKENNAQFTRKHNLYPIFEKLEPEIKKHKKREEDEKHRAERLREANEQLRSTFQKVKQDFAHIIGKHEKPHRFLANSPKTNLIIESNNEAINNLNISIDGNSITIVKYKLSYEDILEKLLKPAIAYNDEQETRLMQARGLDPAGENTAKRFPADEQHKLVRTTDKAKSQFIGHFAAPIGEVWDLYIAREIAKKQIYLEKAKYITIGTFFENDVYRLWEVSTGTDICAYPTNPATKDKVNFTFTRRGVREEKVSYEALSKTLENELKTQKTILKNAILFYKFTATILPHISQERKNQGKAPFDFRTGIFQNESVRSNIFSFLMHPKLYKRIESNNINPFDENKFHKIVTSLILHDVTRLSRAKPPKYAFLVKDSELYEKMIELSIISEVAEACRAPIGRVLARMAQQTEDFTLQQLYKDREPLFAGAKEGGAETMRRIFNKAVSQGEKKAFLMLTAGWIKKTLKKSAAKSKNFNLPERGQFFEWLARASIYYLGDRKLVFDNPPLIPQSSFHQLTHGSPMDIDTTIADTAQREALPQLKGETGDDIPFFPLEGLPLAPHRPSANLQHYPSAAVNSQIHNIQDMVTQNFARMLSSIEQITENVLQLTIPPPMQHDGEDRPFD